MPNRDWFDDQTAGLVTVGLMTPSWVHDISSQLCFVNLNLRSAIFLLDKTSLSQETSRRLKSQIGQAVDLSESTLRSEGMFQGKHKRYYGHPPPYQIAAELGQIGSTWAQKLSNQLSDLNVILRNLLPSLGEIDLSQGRGRDIKSSIGLALDRSEVLSAALEIVQQLLQVDSPGKVVVAELLQDALSLMAPIKFSSYTEFEIESTNVQQSIRTQKQKLLQIVLNILLFTMRQVSSHDKPAKIVLSVQDASTILVTSGNPRFKGMALSTFSLPFGSMLDPPPIWWTGS